VIRILIVTKFAYDLTCLCYSTGSSVYALPCFTTCLIFPSVSCFGRVVSRMQTKNNKGGMHSCMGQAFAFVQVKTILAILFREYDIERISKDMPAIGYEDMVVGPKGNTRIRYTKRRSK
jgi:hypothetical protein